MLWLEITAFLNQTRVFVALDNIVANALFRIILLFFIIYNYMF